MLPKPIPMLTEEAAIRFEEQDKIPLTEEEKQFLRECYELYLKNPIKDL